MKAVLTCLLLLLMTCQAGYSIGRPNNLFVARKAMLERRTAIHQVNVSTFRTPQRLTWRRFYSSILAPCLTQIPLGRE